MTTQLTHLLTNVSDWLTYMNHIHVSAIDMGLERVLPVADKLGILKKDLTNSPYIFTVAGTNGKGSTTALISEICIHAGYKTALYQSPHLVSFNERIKINGTDIDDELLIQAFTECEKARQACELTLSFFEMTTLAAFWVFKQLNCDVWVLEIGLGGRLDVVNIIDPDVCVITNVGIDHVDWLGDTREKIGFEKAGIIRDGVPVIIGEQDIPNSVLEIIKNKNAPSCQYGKDYIAKEIDNDSWIYSSAAMTLNLPKPNIHLINATNAISAILASKLTINHDDIKNGLKKVQLAGRFDKRIIKNSEWIFDVGHNTHGIRFLMSAFIPYWQKFKEIHTNAKLYFLFSMLADKDIDEVLAFIDTFNLPIHEWHIGKIDNLRAIETAELQGKITKNITATHIIAHDSVAAAAKVLLDKATADDVVLCFGSFHTIGESMVALGLADDPKPSQ